MARLMLGLLGPLQITLADAPVVGLESAKTRALLTYLAVEAGRPHRRDTLIGLLWPDYPEATARHNLRQALFKLRLALDDDTAKPRYLLTTREEIQFNAASDFSSDAARFSALCNSGDKAGSDADRAAYLEQAVVLYRGKFLQEFFLEDSAAFEEWALVQREAFHQRALDALAYLANYYEHQGDLATARQHVTRQLKLDPWREEAHRQMMRLLVQDGQVSAALVQYETCRRVLADELGVEPSAETRKLYEQIRSGSWRVPSPHVQPTISNLPHQLSPFIGREHELADLERLIADPACRCISLVGPGGIGKTRLALQVAANSRANFAQGVTFVSLAASNSVESIVPAIATVLGVNSHSPADLQNQLFTFLQQAHLLLVLDNVEHLLDGADLFLEILQHAPQVKLLVTSRQQLNVQGEWVYEVKGLEVPALDAQEIEKYDAVALFVQRARRTQAGFRLAEGDRAVAIQLCRLLDGVPLAIELAAAWVRTLSLAEIVREIERDLDFLSATWRDLPERHRSLRAVFDHSWNMLSAEEQTTLSRLSIFHGGFHRKAAEHVARASLPRLASLVAKSLIRRRGVGESAPFGRYEMHEIIRRYAEEQLIERGQCDEVCREHFQYFLHFAEEAEPQLVRTEQIAWLNRLEQERHNLRAALEWSLKPMETVDDAVILQSLRLAGALVLFWKRRDHWNEGRTWLDRVLSRSSHLPMTEAYVKVLNGAVLLAVEQADTKIAQSLAEKNLALAQDLGDPQSIAWAHNLYGYLLWKQKNFAAARIECGKALDLFRELDDRFGIAESLHYLGHITINQNDCTAAQGYLAESVSVYRELGDRLGFNSAVGDQGLVAYLQGQEVLARSLLEQSLSGARETGSVPTSVAAMNRLGDLARARGDYDQAGKLYAECLELYRRMGDKDEYPSLLHNLGYVERARGDYTHALALFHQALDMQRETSNQAGIAECLEGIASTLIEMNQPEQGARLLGTAEALREKTGAILWPANQIEHTRTLTRLHSALDIATAEANWAEGRHLASNPSFDFLSQ